MTRLAIESTWAGQPADPGERVALQVERAGSLLCMRVDAPDHGDPLPPLPPGECEGLWEYEVVELFLLGEGEHYAELELGPGGHYLLLELQGRRRRVRRLPPARVYAERAAGRWRGELCIALDALPPGLRAWNAYAIHGPSGARRYLAWQPVPGAAPDFHRLQCFAALPESLARAPGQASPSNR